MDSLQMLNLALIGGTAVLLLGALALAGYLWQGWRSGDAAGVERQVRWVGWGGWALASLSILSLPVSAWWLAHLQPWPLSARWLLGGALLYIPAFCAWLLLAGRLQRLRLAVQGGFGEAVTAPLRATQVLAALTLLLFALLWLLVILKPL
ncbi:DUF2269 family protein [Pseudomonas sp. UL073]|uniref:DUF2269 family protein n=1 Tax=Zestomonas insulae TaxID=2809017 RepID=A0ABS2IH89_9GAMM|nr:DUF2269 family protein [Pseudomonas insulae]MBM7062436.1 DUF2269 family protein [Pseudomonas insulae]